MKRNFIIAFVLLVILIGFIFSQRRDTKPTTQTTPKKPVEQVVLAPDWTPNTNHTGIYVALAKGWYKEEGVTLKILPYSSTLSSDVLVSSKKADIGISSTEGVVSDAALGSPVVSIASIMQHNTSSLVVRKDSEITRPKDLDGKVYGGFGAPFEEAVVKKIIQADGGSGEFQNVTLDIDAMQALESGRVDVVWIFDGWDGVAAKIKGIELTSFPIVAFAIPDYATPNIIAHPDRVKAKSESILRFMRATARGYEYAREYPVESANILLQEVPKGTFTDPHLVRQSQLYVSRNYAGAGEQWGVQKKASWSEYPKFMLKEKLLTDAKGEPVTSLDFSTLYSNVFFEK